MRSWVVLSRGTFPCSLSCCCLLQKESDMLRMRVRGLRCHPDQVMKGAKTTAQHLQHDHTFYGFFTVSLPHLYDFPAALCHPKRVLLHGVALVAPHL